MTFNFSFRSANEDDDNRHLWYGGDSGRGPQPNLYPHNTYHGPSPHYRTPLNPAEFKPLRFTDSPQHYGYGGMKTSPNEPTAAPPISSLARNNSASALRRSSNGASSDEEVGFFQGSCMGLL
jgi:hypothetical protein